MSPVGVSVGAMRDLRRARAGVAAVFFVNGALFANLVPRLPDLKASLGMSNAELGMAVSAMPAGAVLAGLFAPRLIRGMGSGRLASWGLVVLAAAFVLTAVVPSWPLLAAVLLVAGGIDALVDVGQNAHGFRVQRGYGRSIINSLHALWSVGAAAGGLVGAVAAGAGISLGVHLLTVSLVFAVVAVLAGRWMLGGPEEAERADASEQTGASEAVGSRTALWPRSSVTALATLGVLAACEAFVQDAGSSWSALFLREEAAATPAAAGLAYVGMQVSTTAGRTFGDRLVDRFGQAPVARVGGLLAAVGLGGALAVPSTAVVVAGFALAGLGVATLAPAVMHTADELPGLPTGVGLTSVNWMLRGGFLLSPLIIGPLADRTGLRVALLSTVVSGLVVLAVGGALRRR